MTLGEMYDQWLDEVYGEVFENEEYNPGGLCPDCKQEEGQ